jgi:hypothetical protein
VGKRFKVVAMMFSRFSKEFSMIDGALKAGTELG